MIKNIFLAVLIFVSFVCGCQAQEVMLISSDNQELISQMEVAKQFGTLNELISQCTLQEPISLAPAAQITYPTLELACKAAKLVMQLKQDSPADRRFVRAVCAITQLLKGKKLPQLCQLLRAVNYLDHPLLIEIVAYLVATELDSATECTAQAITVALKAYEIPQDLSTTILKYYTLQGLDITFGDGGKALIPGGINGIKWMLPGALVLQRPGAILTASHAHTHSNHITVNRYLDDGTRDTTFGDHDHGITYMHDISINAENAARVDDAGNILMTHEHGCDDPIPWRLYNKDGKPVAALSTTPSAPSGKALVHVFTHDRTGNSIVARGTSTQGISSPSKTLLERYYSDGLLDTSFGIAGSTLERDGTTSFLKVHTDGTILAGGTHYGVNREHDFKLTSQTHIARYTPQGMLDTTFGQHGIVTIPPLYRPHITLNKSALLHMHVLDDGSIITGLEYNRFDENHVFVLIKYTRAGLIDTTFGNAGYAYDEVLLPPTFEKTITNCALQADGKILVTGALQEVNTKNPENTYWYIARYNADGTYDTAFGQRGYIRGVHFTADSKEQGSTLLSLSPAQFLVAGDTTTKSCPQGFLARYNVIPPLQQP